MGLEIEGNKVEIDQEDFWKDAEVISTYTRAQAIKDGVLVDVSDAAKGAGIKYPVAVTQNLWGSWIEVPEGLEGIQDETGRLWDVLWMFSIAARKATSDHLTYSVLFQTKERKMKEVQINAVCGPGGNLDPVITIMLPGDD